MRHPNKLKSKIASQATEGMCPSGYGEVHVCGKPWDMFVCRLFISLSCLPV